MNGLSLFSGASIGEVVFKHKIPNYRTVGYVEIDRYCRSIIRARIRDGILDDAPIFDDIRTFNARYAGLYVGKVDFISAGFPCQPFSVAGKRQGADDEHNMWPETLECISIVRPQYAFMENVPGLFAHEYVRRIFGDLAESGYDAEWLPLSASEIGANHKRERMWILAYPNSLKRRYPQERLCAIRLPISLDASQIWERRCESPVLGNSHGVAHRVDRLKALGNGWVPQVVNAILKVEGV